jgi:hypothetical protein
VIAVDNALISKIKGFENSKICRILFLASHDRKQETAILLRPKKLVCEFTNKEIKEIDLKGVNDSQISVAAELVDESEVAVAH